MSSRAVRLPGVGPFVRRPVVQRSNAIQIVLRPKSWMSLQWTLHTEARSMGKPLILLLLVFWVFLAYRALARGDVVMAALFIVVGISITAYRLRGRSSGT